MKSTLARDLSCYDSREVEPLQLKRMANVLF